MKKTELINKACESGLYQLIVASEDYMDVSYTLYKILEFFEKEGMKPPCVTGEECNYHCESQYEWEKEE